MKQIEVIISPEGETTVKTSGFRGAAECKAATKRLETDLGIVTSDTLTQEASLAPNAKAKVFQS